MKAKKYINVFLIVTMMINIFLYTTIEAHAIDLSVYASKYGWTYSGNGTIYYTGTYCPCGQPQVFYQWIGSAPTCTTGGTAEYGCIGGGYCGKSGYKRRVSVDAVGHISASGGTSGVHTKCSICGTTISSAHSYTSSITKSATCTTAGEKTFTCECGYSYTESISATGHDYSTSWTYVDNNGITDGARYHKCKNCSVYKDLQYGCWVSSGTGISAVTGQNWYDAGSSVTLTATVKNGYTWSKWTWTGSGSSTNQTFTFTINNAYQFVANSTANTYSITLDENDGNELSDITYTVETETFNLPTPTRTGYNFIGWTGSNGTTLQTTVSIAKGTTGNKSYTANWELKKFNINTNCSSGGIISNNCEEIYYGDTTSIFIIPMDGYEITNVIVDGKSVGIVDTYDFWDIESDHTVIATFKRTDGLEQYLEALANKYYWIDLEF